ncbi:T9SS type B sorting domain-containing protein [Flavobacterium soyangense]|uniref:T9SS type B sorting domain-containing protein n=1 Tax=Flavobacterium soyangense TaxID=2023265 RepID=A0A930XTT2_9FLAO|nr:choice-of-anchor L domain-containing protein [Flavobacterium soyangense]MBF2707820.1 T9SS type B sorting domain-containing protein [Flavobacterium soyangense]
MKKSLILITSLFWIGCYSQAINVDTSTHTVPQLVLDVLVNKTCVPVSNIMWRTGTNFGSTNGIGYFENTNPAFPLSSGVILSTGDVRNAPGPNTTQLDDGNAAWSGDSDLEATLLAAGISMKSTNATVLEFDFVPFSSNFDFKFLFASEEYGNFQCKFSDAFAFLLTNKTTGVTTNLAVVPSTTIPISVVTIRNSLYNSSCLSENPTYFGAFNGGSNAVGSATNFNGQTVVMNAASSTLTPNITYHIKLVIADRQDNQADSAIFLGANSFNVGQDVLGADLTTARNTAICNNKSQIIRSGLDPKIYSFKWTFNKNRIGGDTPDLIVNQPGVYGLTYTIMSTPPCEVTTDYINVEYNKPIVTPDPVNLYKCDSAGQTGFTYDLSFNTPIVQVPGTKISYHSSSADADSNSNPLPTSYTIATGSLPATIWTRILDITTGCAVTKSFELGLTPPPIANNPVDITLCETTMGSNTADFDLASRTATILGVQSPTKYDVSYYRSMANAITGKNPINTSVIFPSGNATIVAKVQNTTDPTCFNTTSFSLIVKPKPVLDLIPDQYVCIGFTLPTLKNPGNYYSGPNKGLPMLSAGDVITADQNVYIYNETGGTPSCSYETKFNVKIVVPADITPTDIVACDQYLLPKLGFGSRYFTLPGGPTTAGNTELFGGTTLITTSGLVYTYFISTDITPCEVQSKFNITINVTPKITGSFPNVFSCGTYNLPPLTVGNYYTFNAGTGLYTLAVSPITTTTKLYVFAISNTCRTQDKIFTVYIDTIGLVDITQCPAYNLPKAPVGEYRDAPNGGGNIIPPGLIEKTTKVYIYVPGAGTPNCTDNEFFTITINAPFLTTPSNMTACERFSLPAQADGGTYYSGPNKGLPILKVGDIITTTTTIYIYKTSLTAAGCYNEKPWLITINQKPIIDSRDKKIDACNSYVLSPLTNGNYFYDQYGVNPIAAGTIISKNNRIYIYAVNPNDSSCYSENFFDISINGVKADPIPAQLSYCDSFTFPPLPTPNNFYFDAPGGLLGGGKIIPFGTIVTPATVLPKYYIYYETGDRLNCSDENPFTITIAPKPVAYPVTTLVSCDTFGPNDGIFQFDLTTLAIRNQVLNGQTPDANFTLTFFNSLAEANNSNAIPITNPAVYQNDNPFNDSVWIRITNNTVTTPCFDVVELKFIVNPLPISQLKPEYFICEDYETGTLLNSAILNTGIIASNYTFEWTFDGNPCGNTSSITTSQIGNYAVKITNTNTNCINTSITKVTKYSPYLEITYSDAFENPSFISVNVSGAGSGNYQYQIDDSLFQDSNIFNTISPGEHTISVRDKNGHCNPAPINAVIINYPKYFTPNGDGYHETWNITHLASTNPDAPIFIFDRFGKLIKEITPSTDGWNGMYNGEPLPSSDYWFTVNYSEKGTAKFFKAHFSLKR